MSHPKYPLARRRMLATVQTEHGPLTIDKQLLATWNAFGWPTGEVLRQMVARQQDAEQASGDGR